MHDQALLVAGLLALGIVAQWLAWSMRKPAIIFLLGIGLFLGPVSHVFDLDALFGDFLFPFVSLGVAIILFEGALTLNVQEIKAHGRVVTNLVSVGVLITIAVTSLAAWLLMEMELPIALLFGALVCVTGPTVIVPLLRSVRPNKTISNILRWEGVVIDPIGALLVVLVYEYIITGHSALIFAQTIALGVVLGAVAAFFLALLLRRHWLPVFLHNVFTLALVLLVFSGSNALLEESGLLTVTVMGMVLANMKNLPTEEILDFKEHLSVLFISMLFIILSARVDFAGFEQMGYAGLLVLLVIMLVARPVSVWVSAFRSSLTTNEKLLISWIAPRGIVAAAVSSLFVLKLEGSGIQGVDILVPLVFTVIIGTVVIQSLTSKPVARWLGVADSKPNGVLIDGANRFSLALANSLHNAGIYVVLAGQNYEYIRKARMDGIAVYYGSIASEHADMNLDLSGIGHLLAMHSRSGENLLSTLRYQSELGDDHVYRLRDSTNRHDSQRERNKADWQSAWLFAEDVTYSSLMSTLSAGSIKTTALSDNYSYEQYQQDNSGYIPLLALDPNERLWVFSSESELKPQAGWKVMALVRDDRSQREEAELTPA